MFPRHSSSRRHMNCFHLFLLTMNNKITYYICIFCHIRCNSHFESLIIIFSFNKWLSRHTIIHFLYSYLCSRNFRISKIASILNNLLMRTLLHHIFNGSWRIISYCIRLFSIHRYLIMWNSSLLSPQKLHKLCFQK